MKKSLLAFLGIAYINSQCTDNQIGDLCLTDSEVQACHDHLDNLAADTEENPSISNTCEDLVVNDRTRYHFTVSYNDPYSHNADCTTQQITFSGTPLDNGNADLDEWSFNPGNQQITFDIEHDDLVDKYNCIQIDSPDEYLWQCMMDLDILFGGYTQLTYSFHITIILSRVYENQLDITVTKNEVVGECCENELNIITELNFCETFACDNYLPNGMTVVRKQDIFVEHSIASPEFDYYFLHGLQIKLGPFVPEIIDTDGSQAGRLIYHIQSNIALPDMVLEVVSRIAEDAQVVRRLQEEGVGEDYKVKATGNISVEEFLEKSEELEQEKQSNGVLIGVVSALGGLLVLSLIGTTFYCMKVKSQKQNKLQKYEENKTSPQNASLDSQA